MVSIEQIDGVFVLTFPVGFNPNNIAQISSALEQVENHEGPTVLIIKPANSKIFNAGFDVKFLTENGVSAAISIAQQMMPIIARIIRLKCPVISCIDGHAIAGGYLMASIADYLVMRSHGVNIQLNEIVLGLIISEGSNLILRKKLRPDVHRDLVLKGVRFDPQSALDAGLVNELCEQKEIFQRCMNIAKELLNDKYKYQAASDFRVNVLKQAIELSETGKLNDKFIQAMRPKI